MYFFFASLFLSLSVYYKAQEISCCETVHSKICKKACSLAACPLNWGMPQFPSLQQGSCTGKVAVPAAHHGAGWYGFYGKNSLAVHSTFSDLEQPWGLRSLVLLSFQCWSLSFSAASGGELLSFRLGESQQNFAGWQQHRFCVCQGCRRGARLWWVFVTPLSLS